MEEAREYRVLVQVGAAAAVQKLAPSYVILNHPSVSRKVTATNA